MGDIGDKKCRHAEPEIRCDRKAHEQPELICAVPAPRSRVWLRNFDSSLRAARAPYSTAPSGSRPPPALGILNCSDWLCFGARRGYCCGTYDYTGGYCRGRTARATFGPMRAVCASRPTGTKFVAVGRETRPGGRASAVGGRLAGA